MRRGTRTQRVVAAGLGFVCASTLFLAPAAPALAEESELQQLQEKAIAAGEAYQEAQDKVDALNAQIEDTQSRISDLEGQLPGQQSKAAGAIKSEYKLSQEPVNLISLLLDSQSFSDFTSKLYYIESVAQNNFNAISSLNQAASELNDTKAQLQSQQDEATRQTEDAKTAYGNAQQAVEAARKKAMEKAAEQKAAYEAQQAAGQQDRTVTEIEQSEDSAATDDSSQQTANAQAQQTGTGQDTSANANASTDTAQQDASTTNESEGSANASKGSPNAATQSANTNASVAAPTANAASTSASSTASAANTASNANAAANSTATSSASYTYVLASMYGAGDGFMYGTTANGDTVTPTSMGVAMKTMPLGTVIELSYNGRTCRAVVNDRGPYVGNRQIDLQPAVAAALGFDGVGTVGYRVVG